MAIHSIILAWEIPWTEDPGGLQFTGSQRIEHNLVTKGFPDSSVGKVSSCNAGDPSLIPGSGKSAGEGRGYQLRYSWTSPVAQLVKNAPAMRETWVRSVDWEDLQEKGKSTHSSVVAWRIQ